MEEGGRLGRKVHTTAQMFDDEVHLAAEAALEDRWPLSMRGARLKIRQRPVVVQLQVDQERKGERSDLDRVPVVSRQLEPLAGAYFDPDFPPEKVSRVDLLRGVEDEGHRVVRGKVVHDCSDLVS